MSNKELTQQIILYLINKLGDKIEGKKKMMKLMFLIEHYDTTQRKLNPNNLLGNIFSIYYYGVFSLDIMNYVNELIQKGTIKDGFPLTSNKKVSLEKEEIKNRVEKIIDEFGDKTGYKLEVETLKMMDIEPSEKKKFFGKLVSDLIR
jgi:hypothetical protein